MIWFHRYCWEWKVNLLLVWLTGLFLLYHSASLQHHMEMQMAWRLSTPPLSSFASCEVVCVLQSASKTDLFHSLNYSDRWHFLERSGLLFNFFLTSCLCCSLSEERMQCWLLAEPCLYLSVVFWLVWAVCAWRGTVPAWALPRAVGHCFPVLRDNTEIKVYRDICCAQLRAFSLFGPTIFTPFSVLKHNSTGVLTLLKHDFKTRQHLWVLHVRLLLFTGLGLSSEQPSLLCTATLNL